MILSSPVPIANPSFPKPFSVDRGSEHEQYPVTTARRRWHPKLSPFRLSTLVIGVGLGVLKAVLTYQGSQIAPVAVEWICGTMLFLLFYFLDVVEQDRRLYVNFNHWFYDYDCLNLVWKLFGVFKINAPVYSTSEASELNPLRRESIITNYRLLVSGTVMFFGVLKAVLAYLQKADGVTAVDWIFGVVVATGLYILGLYEYNTAKLLPVLFSRNDHRQLLFVGYEGCIIIFAFSMAYLCFLGVNFANKLGINSNDSGALPDLTTLDRITVLSGGMMLRSTLAIYQYFSLYPLFFAIVILLRYFEPAAVLPRLVAYFVQRYCPNYFRTTRNVIPTRDISDFGIFMLRSINHIILHTFGLVTMSSCALAITTTSIRFFSTNIFFGLYILIFGLGAAATIIPIVLSMARPFYRAWRTRVWRGQGRTLGFVL